MLREHVNKLRAVVVIVRAFVAHLRNTNQDKATLSLGHAHCLLQTG